MPSPQALCVEDTALGRFVQCVAVAGGLPGLSLDARGQPCWGETQACACAIWVTADERLALLRPAGAPALTLRRERRVLQVPEEKPVFLVQGDELDIGGRSLRLHLHGPTQAVRPPAPLEARPARRLPARTAGLVAASALVVRCNPPKLAPDTAAHDPCPTVAPASQDFGSVPLAQDPPPTATFTLTNACGFAIEVRELTLDPPGAPFTLDQAGPATVDAEGAFTVTVTFDPQAAGSYTATLAFVTWQEELLVGLEGEAVAP
jgi:hypothetical protein